MPAAADDGTFELKGYYKNLFATSRTPAPENERFTLDLNRLRLEVRDRPVTWLDYEIQYDHEALLGSYLRTALFARQKSAPTSTYFDADSTYADHDDLYAHHRLYRAFARVREGGTTLSLGRQRIAWGSGRIWNPTDLLNPWDPAQLETNERAGLDAALVDQAFGPLTQASAVYAPSRDAPDSWAVRLRSNYAGTDAGVMGGRIRGKSVLGGEFAGHIRDAGLYGEGAYVNASSGSKYVRAVLGTEYAFANTLTIGGELYWNGAGANDPARYDVGALSKGTIQNLARRYAGVQARYELTPLLRIEALGVFNADDSSRLLTPALVYSIVTDLDVGTGLQYFEGPTRSEYGMRHNVYFAYAQWFF